MKLLFFSEVYTPWQGGAIVAIRNLMTQFTNKGHEVIMVTGEERKRWRLKGVRSEYDEQCHARVIRIPAIPYPFNKAASMTIPDFGAIKHIILTEKPDCIHIFSPVGIAGKIAMRDAKHLGIPVVVTNHIMPENFTLNVKLPRSLKTVTEKLIYKDLIDFCNKAKIVTAPTKTAIGLLLKRGLQSEYHVVTNGVDADYFQPGKPPEKILERFNLKQTDKYILYIGRLDGEKRVDLLVQAMPFVSKRIPHAKLLIGGKGLQNTNLNELVEKLQVKDNVSFLGMVTEEEKLALLQTTDIFAIASPSELQCIAALEALSCGLPIVVANQMALQELTNNDKNGLQFSYPKAQDLADKLCILLENSKQLEEMSKNGREWILKHHQLSRVYELFEPIYHKALQSRVV